VNQMMRYYDRCFSWYKSLVTKNMEQTSDSGTLRASARYASEPGEIHDVIQSLWSAGTTDHELLEQEVKLVIEASKKSRLEVNDVIQDRDTISSLCLMYTSMKWLAVKVAGLRHITKHETDSSRQSIPRNANRRWTLLDDLTKASPEQGPVTLPLTQETVQ
jgi:exocyst complex component 4